MVCWTWSLTGYKPVLKYPQEKLLHQSQLVSLNHIWVFAALQTEMIHIIYLCGRSTFWRCFSAPADPLSLTWVSFITTTRRRRCTCRSRASAGWWGRSRRRSLRRSSGDHLSSSESALSAVWDFFFFFKRP